MERPTFDVPTRDQVSPTNQSIFDKMTKGIGMVPNLYATFAWSDDALADYLALQNRKTTLSVKEKEIVNLVVSEVNNCEYCRRAHSAVAGKFFSPEQLLEIRRADVTFDNKLRALAAFVKDVTVSRGHASEGAVEALFAAGYDKANLVDIMIGIGDKTISNYLHGVTHVPVEFPEVPAI